MLDLRAMGIAELRSHIVSSFQQWHSTFLKTKQVAIQIVLSVHKTSKQWGFSFCKTVTAGAAAIPQRPTAVILTAVFDLRF